MKDHLLDLARLEITLQRLLALRWGVRAGLFIALVLSLTATPNQSPFFLGLLFLILPIEIILDLFGLFLHQEAALLDGENRSRGEGMTRPAAVLLAVRQRSPLHLWYRLTRDPSVQFVLYRLGVDPLAIYQELAQPPSRAEWLALATRMAKIEKRPLAPQHLFEVLQIKLPLSKLWDGWAISRLDRQDVWAWYNRLTDELEGGQSGFLASLAGSAGIGRDWSSGYTRALDLFAVDVSRSFARLGASISLVGHEEERKKIIEYLSRDRRHNVILIGEEGIGKQRLIYTLAADLNRGTLPPILRHKHLYQLDVGRLVSGQSQEVVEERLQAVLNEASEAGNIILAVPDLELLLGAQGNRKLGVVDASGLLGPYLESPKLQIIAAATPGAYYTYVQRSPMVSPQLFAVEVKEIKAREALIILEDEVFHQEAKSRIFFTYQALRKIIALAEAHVHDRPNPEKALELLDEVAGALAAGELKVASPQVVEAIVSRKLKIPLGQPAPGEREILNNLETLIRERIVGQAEAVKTVADALRRARAGLHSGKRPIGSFLFIGPTGVGKTEMARTIAAIYYQNPKAFIRLDMSEYQTSGTVEKLIGSQNRPGLLTTAITDQPYSVVLLDEIEKAETAIRNLFLQILDYGHITDGDGRNVDFTDAMVIATSNAGSEFTRQAVREGTYDSSFKTRLLEQLQNQGIFSPEWLNRFDAIVTFLPLTRDQIREIAKLRVAELTAQLKGHNINLTVGDDVYDLLVEKGFDPQFGARPMGRAVQEIVETALAKTLLNDTTEGVKNITLSRAMLV